jgi:hypothetical protein
MENEKLRETASQIVDFLGFDINHPDVQTDINEIVQLMLENGLEAK